MDETYDVIVCGTGMKECILAGLMAVDGKKVLHLDKNNYYGAASASLNISTLYTHFNKPGEPPQEFGANRDWNVDLVPKFVMAGGELVDILLHTKVSNYLEWKTVDASYVYQYQAAGLLSGEKFIHKVPASDSEALKSPLMGMMEKNRCKNFFVWAQNFDASNQNTWGGLDPRQNTMQQLYEKFGLQIGTIDFLGHAVALQTSDNYLNMPYGPTIDKVQLYMKSMGRYGNSPFLYPVYGLGGIPEGFARLCAIHGGTFMLDQPIDEFVYDGNGRVSGVRSGDKVAHAPIVICDPSYAALAKDAAGQPKTKIQSTGRVIRAICILNQPIPGVVNSNNQPAESCQIIIPQRELKRNCDVYITMLSNANGVTPQNKYVAIVSTEIPAGCQNPGGEIQPALQLLGKGNIAASFCSVVDMYSPTDAGAEDGVYVTASYDCTSHFEQATQEVLQIYTNLTGKKLDLSKAREDQ